MDSGQRTSGKHQVGMMELDCINELYASHCMSARLVKRRTVPFLVLHISKFGFIFSEWGYHFPCIFMHIRIVFI